MADALDNALLHEGRLLVKTEGPLGRRSWVLRHVLVTARTLEWFADAGLGQLVGSVSLDGGAVLLPAAPRHPFLFELDWDGQDYLPLRALSALELREWISVSVAPRRGPGLRHALRAAGVGRSPPQSRLPRASYRGRPAPAAPCRRADGAMAP
jgi:hypothetical protein